MRDINIIIDTTVSESKFYESEEKDYGQVINFPGTANSVTGQVDDTISYQTNADRNDQFKQYRVRKDLRDKILFDQIRKKTDNEIINYAYHSIVDALDCEMDRIERSNLFDEWKDTLESIIAEVTNISVNHRKILGALIVAVKDKDISDFTSKGLNLLRDATYMFRQLRVSKNDSQRIIKDLIGIGVCPAIPLLSDDISGEDEEDLDQLMAALVERSKQL